MDCMKSTDHKINLKRIILIKCILIVCFIVIVQIAVDAAAGILHLHKQGIIHRDIAARNIFLDEKYRGKVGVC